jgi:hypothetical protein
LLKKFKKYNDYGNLDARYWIQMAILSKNYIRSKN